MIPLSVVYLILRGLAFILLLLNFEDVDNEGMNGKMVLFMICIISIFWPMIPFVGFYIFCKELFNRIMYLIKN